MRIYNIVKTVVNPKTSVPTIEVIATKLTYFGAKHFLANYLELAIDDDVLDEPYIFNHGDGTDEHEEWDTYYSIVCNKTNCTITGDSSFYYTWRIARNKSDELVFILYDRNTLNEVYYTVLDEQEVSNSMDLLSSNLYTDVLSTLVFFGKILPLDWVDDEVNE